LLLLVSTLHRVTLAAVHASACSFRNRFRVLRVPPLFPYTTLFRSGYVPDLAFEHRDVLALRVGPLVMQPAQHAAGGRRHVALHEARREAVRAQLVEVERLEKEAAIVAEHPRLDDDATGQAGLDQLHGT